MEARDRQNFASLSVKDLLEAREAYHVHLARLENVFATAIGRYLIHDKDPNAKDPNAKRPTTAHSPLKTLANTVVTKWSWPCVLVFVDHWKQMADFAKKPAQFVPPRLYLPDGRVVPTCVVYASRGVGRGPTDAPIFPSDLLGGGYPAFTEVQNQTHLSSMGCLVTDGDSTFVLTNKHVSGEAGRSVHTFVNGQRQRVGVSAGRDLGKRPFEDVYRGWPGERVSVTLDAGLVRVDDVNRWTAQVYGVGEMGSVWDLNVDTFNLDIVNCPVRAFGAGSGALSGRILGLFFRYKSVGGIEYVADFLIGPREGSPTVGTRRGDSGTIWFEDAAPAARTGAAAPKLRPFAMQWGMQNLQSPEGGMSSDFALATCLSTICRELDVDIIADWNVGQPETWGAVGHYKIGALACDLVTNKQLRKLMQTNKLNVGYDDDDLQNLPKFVKGKFCPLADVPDFVWRSSRKLDASNHFADMDEESEAAPFKGKTLFALTRNKPQNVDPAVWIAFYRSLGQKKMGALPFRVWQMFDEMVDFAAANDYAAFVCAAGIMAHYVGDACQPLHVSKLHHGEHEGEMDVHSVYETSMLNACAADLIAALAALKAKGDKLPAIKGSGHDIAVEVVELMRRTSKRLPPEEVLDAFRTIEGGAGRSQRLWAALGKDTAACQFDGAQTLAAIWTEAWRRGRLGKAQAKIPANPIDRRKLMKLYNTKSFLQAYRLDQLVRQGDRLVEA